MARAQVADLVADAFQAMFAVPDHASSAHTEPDLDAFVAKYRNARPMTSAVASTIMTAVPASYERVWG